MCALFDAALSVCPLDSAQTAIAPVQIKPTVMIAKWCAFRVRTKSVKSVTSPSATGVKINSMVLVRFLLLFYSHTTILKPVNLYESEILCG